MTKSSACTQRGMSNREISAHMKEIYGVGVSAEFISRVTDEVLEDVRAWRSRPLQDFLSGGLFDALRVKVKTAIPLRPKPCILPWPLEPTAPVKFSGCGCQTMKGPHTGQAYSMKSKLAAAMTF